MRLETTSLLKLRDFLHGTKVIPAGLISTSSPFVNRRPPPSGMEVEVGFFWCLEDLPERGMPLEVIGAPADGNCCQF